VKEGTAAIIEKAGLMIADVSRLEKPAPVV